MTSAQLLQEQARTVAAQHESLDLLLSGLNAEQLAWQPHPGKWSIIECIEHLNIAMEHYLVEMQGAIPAAISKGSEPATDFRSGFWGKRLPKMFEPKDSGRIKWKMKTMSRFQPEPAMATGDQEKVIRTFRGNLDRIASFIEQAEQVNLNRVLIVSAIGTWLKFRLGDAFRFLTAHNARHILQAQRVREAMLNPATGNSAPLAASL